MRSIWLSETDIVLNEGVPARQYLTVRDAHIGSSDSAVVQVKGLNVHFFHGSILA